MGWIKPESHLFSSVVKNLICIFYVSHLVILLIVMSMPQVSRSLYIEPFSLTKFSLVLYYFTIFVRLLWFQNVRFQNVWFQNVRFQNVRFTKRQIYKTSGFQTSGFKTSSFLILYTYLTKSIGIAKFAFLFKVKTVSFLLIISDYGKKPSKNVFLQPDVLKT